MPGITDVAIIPHTPQRRRRRRRPGRHLRAVHRRDPRARRGLGPGHGGREVRRQRARRPEEGRAAGAAAGQPARQDARPAVHVLLPPRRPARDQLRRRGRPAGQRRDLVEPEDADLGAGADRPEPGPAGRQGQGARGPGRRLVRPPPVRRRRLRGRRHLQEARQAREADVASHRQLPPGPRPSDGHLARARALPGRRTCSPSTSATPASPPTGPRLRRAAERELAEPCPGRTSATPS